MALAIDGGSAVTPIVTLAQAKTHLNITGTRDDDELRFIIDAATRGIEQEIGPIGLREITETVYASGGRLLLSTGPVVDVLDPVGATYQSGTLTTSGGFRGAVTVRYRAGWDPVPADIRQAGLDYIEDLWKTQRSPVPAMNQDTDDSFAGMRAGYAKSYRVMEQLKYYNLRHSGV